MPIFTYAFAVNAPVTAVSAFHHDTSVLKTLTPPPIFAQIHRFDPMGEGAVAEFTLWFGPLPVRWQAIHSEVGEGGFTDTQVSGPLQSWQHRHSFIPLDANRTRIEERIEYSHHDGPHGLLSRLLFAKPGLYLLFTARKMITRWHLEYSPAQRKTAVRTAIVTASLTGLLSLLLARKNKK
jgi:ligand-binding SRPBCC domain-containing protein